GFAARRDRIAKRSLASPTGDATNQRHGLSQMYSVVKILQVISIQEPGGVPASRLIPPATIVVLDRSLSGYAKSVLSFRKSGTISPPRGPLAGPYRNFEEAEQPPRLQTLAWASIIVQASNTIGGSSR
ncbi:6082_t:CDS:2, partial [Acaulospora colombiana]